MKKKNIILSILALLVPLAAIGTAFASFSYSTKVDKEDKQSGAYLDDIKPNFKIKEDNYTVYFFPSMQIAKEIKANQNLFIGSDDSVLLEKGIREVINSLNPIDSITPFGSDWGKWSSSSLADGLFEEIDKEDYLQYYPKKVVTKGGPSISLDEYKKVGEPFTDGFDNSGNNNVLEFAGWTADIDAAIDSYSNQGDYKFVSAFNDFYDVDYSSIENSFNNDGTKANDHIVFLFPIFTTGKNYTDVEDSSLRIRNNKSDRNYYLAKTFPSDDFENTVETTNKGYYYFKNLVIKDDEDWSLEYDGIKESGGWQGSWQSYTQNDTNKKLFDKDGKGVITESGIYNVYIYQFRGKDSFISTSASEYYRNTLTNDKVPLVYFDDPTNNKTRRIVAHSIGDDKYWTFIKVEKVFEFKLLGLENRGFSLDTGSQLHLSNYDSLTTVNDSDRLSNGPWKVYYLDNVYLGSGLDMRYNQFGSGSNTYKVKRKVFSFLSDNNNMNIPFSSMSDTELAYINKTENVDDQLVYETFSSSSEVFDKLDTSKTLDKDGNKYIDFGTATDSVSFPFEYDKDNYLDYFFTSNLKYSSYCRILLLVCFNSSSGEPSNIKVAIAPYQKDSYTIYVYPNFGSAYDGVEFKGTTNPYRQDYLNYIETGLNSRKDQLTGLIDPEQDEFLEKIVLAKIKVYKKHDYMLDGYNLEDSSGNKEKQYISVTGKIGTYLGEMSVEDYFNNYLPNNNKEIIDHITGKTIQMNLQFKRFVACYITDIK